MMPDSHYFIDIKRKDTISQLDCDDTVLNLRIMEVHLQWFIEL
ncbi:hypothetical protein [Haloarcula hispanica]|nr:hypothetical protein [Haloarcula hispanica]